jgi:hypothetical protein
MFNFNSLANAERTQATLRALQGETQAEFLLRAAREAAALRDQAPSNQAHPWFRLTGGRRPHDGLPVAQAA